MRAPPSHHSTGEWAWPNLWSPLLFLTSLPISILKEFLTTLGLPLGLLLLVMACYNLCQLTLWILDNSSSLKVRNSHVVVCPGGSGGGDNPKVVESSDKVTRRHEVQDWVSFHSYMAAKCWIHTKMWLVNADVKDGHKVSLCCGSLNDLPDKMSHLKSTLKLATLAQDQCLLTAQVHKMIDFILPMASSALNAHNQKIIVVICTQGLPADEHRMLLQTVQQEFWSELKTLSKLPVKIIIRLCTQTMIC